MAKVEILKDYCKSCKLCMQVCPKQVLRVGTYTNKMGYDAVEMDETKGCIGCKMCAPMCPEGAIEVYR